jgi:hypothetical protein
MQVMMVLKGFTTVVPLGYAAQLSLDEARYTGLPMFKRVPLVTGRIWMEEYRF